MGLLPFYTLQIKLDRHKKKEHDPDKGLPQCSLCPEALRVNHMEDHHGSKKYQCQGCSYGSQTSNDVRTHESRFHPELAREKCPDCSTVILKRDMNRHKKHHHDPSLPYACDECNYRGSTKGSIVHHKRLMHHIGDRYECPKCGKTYADQTYLDYHVKTHCSKRDRAFECPNNCGKAFGDDRELGNHATKHCSKRNKPVNSIILPADEEESSGPGQLDQRALVLSACKEREVLAVTSERQLDEFSASVLSIHAARHGLNMKSK